MYPTKDPNAVLKQHAMTILSILAIIVLFLPFLTVTVEVNSSFVSANSAVSITGFTAMGSSGFGYLMLIAPIALIAMNYVKQLEAYKKLMAIAIPVICIFIEIFTFLIAKSSQAQASGGGASANIKATMEMGFFALLIIYVLMAIVGAVVYNNITLDKAGLEKLRAEGSELIGSGFNKIREGGSTLINSAEQRFSGLKSTMPGAASGATPSAPAPSDATPPAPAAKGVNFDKTQETLALIEKLAAMRDSGILTEEEFSAKKQELLKEML